MRNWFFFISLVNKLQQWFWCKCKYIMYNINIDLIVAIKAKYLMISLELIIECVDKTIKFQSNPLNIHFSVMYLQKHWMELKNDITCEFYIELRSNQNVE